MYFFFLISNNVPCLKVYFVLCTHNYQGVLFCFVLFLGVFFFLLKFWIIQYFYFLHLFKQHIVEFLIRFSFIWTKAFSLTIYIIITNTTGFILAIWFCAFCSIFLNVFFHFCLMLNTLSLLYFILSLYFRDGPKNFYMHTYQYLYALPIEYTSIYFIAYFMCVF